VAFDKRKYRGKERIYIALVGASQLSTLYIWNADKKEYQAPERGKPWVARRREVIDGKVTRVQRFFENVEAARAWQGHVEAERSIRQTAKSTANLGPTMLEVVEKFREVHFPKLAAPSRVNYEQQLALHFSALMKLHVHNVTPTKIDQWLVGLKEVAPPRRWSFEKEVALLTTILRFYDEYWDDSAFKLPVKKRHRDDAVLRRRVAKKERRLSYEDFLKVREAALTSRYGERIYVMMTMQYRQALRIGEVAGLQWRDVQLDSSEEEDSWLKIRRHISWSRKKGTASEVSEGLKNSKSEGICKEHPVYPESYEALTRLFEPRKNGCVFPNDAGGFFTYRVIQNA